MSRRGDIKRLLAERKRYLTKLQEQQTSFGAYTPPHILIDIEDTEAEIKELEAQLDFVGELEDDTDQPYAGSRSEDYLTTGDQISKEHSGGVTIGDVSGGIHNSLFAGGDITQNINAEDIESSTDETQSNKRVERILVEIRHDLTKIQAHVELLRVVSSAVPFLVQGASECVSRAVEMAKNAASAQQADAIRTELQEATSLLAEVEGRVRAATQEPNSASQNFESLIQSIETATQKLDEADQLVEMKLHNDE